MVLAVETLQHFLHDREARDDLVEVDVILERDGIPPSEDGNPDGRVNENHDPSRDRRADPRGRRTGRRSNPRIQ